MRVLLPPKFIGKIGRNGKYYISVNPSVLVLGKMVESTYSSCNECV